MSSVNLPLNFGHRPRQTKSISRKLFQCYTLIFGAPNLYKRCQMREIFEVLDLKESDKILDFGCTSGYMTVEMSKKVNSAIGLDIIQSDVIVDSTKLPGLKFVKYDGDITNIPLEKSSFSKILVSEVLYIFPEPTELFSELKKLLVPGGELVVVNGMDRPFIRDAYEKNKWTIRLFKWGKYFNDSYEKYEAALNSSFKGATPRFVTVDEVRQSLDQNEFKIVEQRKGMKDSVARVVEWLQFLCLSLFNRPGLANNPLTFPPLFLLFSVMKRLTNKKSSYSSLLLRAKAP